MENNNDKLEFYINGEKRNLNNVDINTTLLEHLRLNEELTGTKKSCGQGGCGACTVTVSEYDEESNKIVYKSLLSCLTPIGALDGKNVTTVEGLGNPINGLHPVQERMAKLNGSQCGFCTPGMVNNIYSTIKIKNGEPTLKDFQESTDGNICRCTGYRPILESANTFAVNCKECPNIDIEEIGTKFKKYNPKTDDPKEPPLENIKITSKRIQGNDGSLWYQPLTLSQVLNIKKENKGKKVRVMTGNTSTGVYGRDNETQVYIYTGKVKELKQVKVDNNGLTVGSAVTIYELLENLEKLKNKSPNSFPTLISHIRKIASRHIRMNGTWTGNLFMARDRGFGSDLATVVFGVGAKLSVINEKEETEERDIETFLSSKDDIVVVSMTIPFVKENEFFESYRVSLRSQLSHPLINSAFRVVCNQDNTIKQAFLVYGVVAKHAIRAKKTESFLVGKTFDEKTFSEAIDHLREDINISKHPETQYFTIHQPEGKEQYRSNLVVHFFFKFFCKMRVNLKLSLNESYLSIIDESVCYNTKRPISHGQSDYEVGEGRRDIPKIDIESLVSGQALYTVDLPTTKRTLFGAFITGNKIGYKVKRINVEGALKLPGVVDVVLPSDIKGKNEFLDEPIFAEQISFYGQPVGLVLAETQFLADQASQKIEVEYGEQFDKQISLTIETSKELGLYHKGILKEIKTGDSENGFIKSDNVLEGTTSVGTQIHFYMEKQNAYAVPDDGNSIKVYVGNQGPELTKTAISEILGVPNNQVNVINKRIGGGFGGRLTRQILVGGAAAVAARKRGVPVKIELSINNDQSLVGGRYPLTTNYKIGFDNDGTIKSLLTETHLESGIAIDLGDELAGEFINTITNCYYVPNYTGRVRGLKTNLPTRTAVRGFGHTEGTFVCETIIEKIATHLNLTIEEVREKNMFNKTNCIDHTGKYIEQCNIREIYTQVKESSEYEKRLKEVEIFNKQNKFKKRGISVGGIKYSLVQSGSGGATAIVNVNNDGTVVVFHGGAEMGQGIHTKVALRVAEAFGIDVSFVKIGETNTDISVMTQFTGGSIGSEVNAEAARIACEKIKKRVAHLRFQLYKELNREPTWAEIVNLAYKKKLLMSETANFVSYGHEDNQFRTPYNSHGTTYFGFGASTVEVEVDVLTGEMNVLRADLLYDCGNSLNPLIDLGQTEGAFIWGIGYLFKEEVLISNEGRTISDDTWEYKPPMAFDIPIDFRVSLLKGHPFLKGVGQSKAVGEPPMLLAVNAYSALRKALQNAKQQKNLPTIDIPITIDRIQTAFGLIDYKKISF